MKSFTIFASLILIVVISNVAPSSSQVYGGNPAYKIEILPEQISSEDASDEGGSDRFARMPKRPPYEPLKYAISNKKMAAFSMRGKKPAASNSTTTTTSTTSSPTTSTTPSSTTTSTTSSPITTSTTPSPTTTSTTPTPANQANVTSEAQNR